MQKQYWILHKPRNTLSEKAPAPHVTRTTVYDCVRRWLQTTASTAPSAVPTPTEDFDRRSAQALLERFPNWPYQDAASKKNEEDGASLSCGGAVGRLAFETSGLLLFTSDGKLTRAMCGASQAWREVPKVYSLVVAGRFAVTKGAAGAETEDLDPKLRNLLLASQVGAESDSAVESLPPGILECQVVAAWQVNEVRSPGKVPEFARAAVEESLQRAITKRSKSSFTTTEAGSEAPNAHLPYGGWYSVVELTLKDPSGEVLQRISQTLKRSSECKLRHVHRWALGPLHLQSTAPGECRFLEDAEIAALYAAAALEQSKGA